MDGTGVGLYVGTGDGIVVMDGTAVGMDVGVAQDTESVYFPFDDENPSTRST